jgi:hypothetical protein
VVARAMQQGFEKVLRLNSQEPQGEKAEDVGKHFLFLEKSMPQQSLCSIHAALASSW